MKKRVVGLLAVFCLLVVGVCGSINFVAMAEEPTLNVWEKKHNDNARINVDKDNNVILSSDGSGAVNNDVAFFRTDETYKVKQDGFYIRFTYQEFDNAGEPVENLNGKSHLRFIFADQKELGEALNRSTLVTRLNMYYDDSSAAAPNGISKRNEASMNYWGSKQADSGFSIDNWFTGSPYGGHFYADGATENTFVLKWANRDGVNKLWACINDFWYPANSTPAGVQNLTPTVDTWAGAQGQAHSYVNNEWVSAPGMEDLLNELDSANTNNGAYFALWANKDGGTGGSNDVNIKITAMGSPKAPTVKEAQINKKVEKGEQSVDLNKHFSQPNFDDITFTAKKGDENVGTITNGVWTHNFDQIGASDVVFTALANNNNLSGYFADARTALMTIKYNVVNIVTAKDATALTKTVTVGDEVKIDDISAYFNKGSASDELTFTSSDGIITGSAWKFTPSYKGAKLITISASDGFKTASIQFTITANPKAADKPVVEPEKSEKKGCNSSTQSGSAALCVITIFAMILVLRKKLKI